MDKLSHIVGAPWEEKKVSPTEQQQTAYRTPTVTWNESERKPQPQRATEVSRGRPGWNPETPAELREHFIGILQQLKPLNLTVEVIGAWIWVSGQSRPVADKLKRLGFFWSGNKKRWYYRPKEYRSRAKKPLAMEEIRRRYQHKLVQLSQESHTFPG